METFINTDSKFPVIIQAAIAHAQFESIHPFLDGNGRVGRLFIPLMFKLKQEHTLSNLFISKQLEENKFKYYSLLNGTRKEIPEWSDWICFFMESVLKSIEAAIIKYDKILSLYHKHENPDDLSYTKVLNALFKNPIITVSLAQENTGLSRPTVVRVLNKIMDDKLIYRNDNLRNIQYICYDLIQAIQKAPQRVLIFVVS